MAKRIKLRERKLPTYSKGEEITNMVTHIIGGALGIAALVLCVIRAALRGGALDIVGAAIYGTCLVCLYTMSSVYHGLHPGTGKRVLQILDHCTIYFLIAGSYTPIAFSAVMPEHFGAGLFMVITEWVLTALAVTLTAIDLKKFNAFSQTCYIVMGWLVLPFLPMMWRLLGPAGFTFLLTGGLAYTVGAIFYAIGSKKKWMHSVFHVFVLAGSVLHFFAIFFYAL